MLFNTVLFSISLYISINWVVIGSGNVFSLVWLQAITFTNANLLLIGPTEETKFTECESRQIFFFQENVV